MQHLSSDWKLQELYVPFTVPHCASISKFLNVFVSGAESTAVKDTGTFAGGGGKRIDNTLVKSLKFKGTHMAGNLLLCTICSSRIKNDYECHNAALHA